jgi:hypothetical protein
MSITRMECLMLVEIDSELQSLGLRAISVGSVHIEPFNHADYILRTPRQCELVQTRHVSEKLRSSLLDIPHSILIIFITADAPRN